MTFRKRLIVGLTALFGSKVAWATTTGVVAATTATQFGRDPVPWLIGAAAVTVVYAYRKPATREHALANGVISVFLGGIGAPWMGSVLSFYINPLFANDWLLAGILGAGWPWLVPVGLSLIQRRAEKIGG